MVNVGKVYTYYTIHGWYGLGSMYGIFIYICLVLKVDVGIDIPYMDPRGKFDVTWYIHLKSTAGLPHPLTIIRHLINKAAMNLVERGLLPATNFNI